MGQWVRQEIGGGAMGTNNMQSAEYIAICSIQFTHMRQEIGGWGNG